MAIIMSTGFCLFYCEQPYSPWPSSCRLGSVCLIVNNPNHHGHHHVHWVLFVWLWTALLTMAIIMSTGFCLFDCDQPYWPRPSSCPLGSVCLIVTSPTDQGHHHVDWVLFILLWTTLLTMAIIMSTGFCLFYCEQPYWPWPSSCRLDSVCLIVNNPTHHGHHHVDWVLFIGLWTALLTMAIIMSTGFCLFGLIRRRIFLIVSKCGRITGLSFQQCSINCVAEKIKNLLLPNTYEVWGKVMFLQAFVILSTIGGGEVCLWRGLVCLGMGCRPLEGEGVNLWKGVCPLRWGSAFWWCLPSEEVCRDTANWRSVCILLECNLVWNEKILRMSGKFLSIPSRGFHVEKIDSTSGSVSVSACI